MYSAPKQGGTSLFSFEECSRPLSWACFKLVEGKGGRGRHGAGCHRNVPVAGVTDAAAPAASPEDCSAAGTVEGMFRTGFPGYSEAENLRL